ncbi:Hemerythrin HHE cation binding domain-containing protein [Actinopolymorpha cephalotaxi]|uniref:Hemerythrin HHE cation binding domain-containing protein n=1 Tax=Actinopolymorpha cephalotaxi TaxID=504797 RepID=A0A1I2XBM1_9ACTN|nr:hemerythrin domain-containing protein [Actinopolymorpha cephalotaxi]NYH86098.1 hypothetical protein [Actinopolymorpha cephalotaxi]SFH09401.1 Hemerythrin HHE cation binding domain-containing protein [Actinopolymorpha cephalotaxi]
MNHAIIATSEDDARAAEAVVRHHAELTAALARRAAALGEAATSQDAESAEAARRELVTWCEAELIPHAVAEEKAMYPAAHVSQEGRLLVDGMLAEHRSIIGLVREVASADGPVPAAAAARALQALFDSHLAKENDQVLPLLAASTEVSMADLLAGMHELVGEQPRHGSGG